MTGSSAPDPQDPPPASALADPTRDIRLPPLPGTRGPELPPEWKALRPTQTPDPPPPGEALAEQPTDKMAPRSPRAVDRNPTLTFTGSAAERWAAGHATTPDPAWSSVPAGPGPVVVSARKRARRWPWIVLTLLPLLVIAVTGAWLLLLVR